MLPTFSVLLGGLASLLLFANAQGLHTLGPRQQDGSYTTWGIVLKFPWKTYIDSWNLTFTVPPVPSPQKDQAYSVVSLETNSLGYALELASYGNPSKIGCKAKAGQWCLTPFYYTATVQTNGTIAVVNPGDVLSYSFKQESPTSGTLGPGYRIKATRNGQVLTQLRAPNDVGLAIAYVIASQCDLNSQKLPEFDYTNLAYGLGLPYPNFFVDSPPGTDHSTNTKPYTANGGLTWKIDSVKSLSVQCNV